MTTTKYTIKFKCSGVICVGLGTRYGGIMIIERCGDMMEFTPAEFAEEMEVLTEEEVDFYEGEL